MKKPKFKIWLGLLLALFLGSLGSLDQVWCFEAGGRCDPKKRLVARQVLQNPRVSVRDVPTAQLLLGGFRSGHLRVQGASWLILRRLTPISCMRLVLPQGDYSGDLSSQVPSTVFNSFAFLRTVILII